MKGESAIKQFYSVCGCVVLVRHSLNQLGSYIVAITVEEVEPKPRVGSGTIRMCECGWGRTWKVQARKING